MHKWNTSHWWQRAIDRHARATQLQISQQKGVCENSVMTSAHTARQSGTFLHDPITHYKSIQLYTNMNSNITVVNMEQLSHCAYGAWAVQWYKGMREESTQLKYMHKWYKTWRFMDGYSLTAYNCLTSPPPPHLIPSTLAVCCHSWTIREEEKRTYVWTNWFWGTTYRAKLIQEFSSIDINCHLNTHHSHEDQITNSHVGWNSCSCLVLLLHFNWWLFSPYSRVLRYRLHGITY